MANHSYVSNTNSVTLIGPSNEAVTVYNVYLSFVIALGVPGNLLVLLVYLKHRRVTSTDWFIIFITLCDFISSTINVPVYLTFTSGAWEQYGSDIICKLHMFLSQSVVLSSTFLICGIAVERYWKVCQASRTKLAPMKSRNICLAISMIAALLSMPTFGLYHNNKYKRCSAKTTGLSDELINVYYIAVLLTFVVAIVILIVSYTMIARVILESERNLKKHDNLKREGVNKKVLKRSVCCPFFCNKSQIFPSVSTSDPGSSITPALTVLQDQGQDRLTNKNGCGESLIDNHSNEHFKNTNADDYYGHTSTGHQAFSAVNRKAPSRVIEPCHRSIQYGQTDTKRANGTKAITGSAMEKQNNSCEPDESIRKTTEGCDKSIRKTTESFDESITKTTDSCGESITKTTESCDESIRKTTESFDEGIRKTTESCDECIRKSTESCDESIRKTTESCDETIRKITGSCGETVRKTTESCGESIRKTTESCDESIRKTGENHDESISKTTKRCASYELIDQPTFPLNPPQTSNPMSLVTKSAINRHGISKSNVSNLTSLSLTSTVKRHTKRQDLNSTSFDKGSTIERGGNRKSLRMTMIAFLVCLIFVLSWLPPWLIFIVNLFLSNEARSTQTYSTSGLFCKMAYLINSFTNPILYTVLNKNFREKLRNICALNNTK